MRNILILVLFCSFTVCGLAQSPLNVDRIQANAGVGFEGKDGEVPFYFGADYGIMQDWTAGARASFNGYLYPLTIAVNANYHLDSVLGLPSEWNVYGGANAGYVDQRDDHGKAEFGLQIGSRYFFKQSNWGANLEFGGGTERTAGRLGITYVF